jgi:lysophospholipase L1-like esterase
MKAMLRRAAGQALRAMHLCAACALLAAYALLAGTISAQQDAVTQSALMASEQAATIELIGDSTQTDAAGYGRGFCANLSAAVTCVNLARGGASTKTYRAMGLWDKALASKPQYMLIQFGHNDEPSLQHAERETTMAEYEANLRRYVTEARAAGITPVLVTPLTRRYFGPDGRIHSDLTAHAETMKRVAAQMHVPLIDLQADSISYLDGLGAVRGQALGITKKDSAGTLGPDKTHLNWEGSYAFGRIVAVDLGKAVPTLAQYVLPKAATLPPEGVTAMRLIRADPVKIVLVGDSTVAVGGGWGPGFCATLTPNVTCVDLAANGRSSKSYLDEGRWKQALGEHGDVYFIQFGHNDQKPDAARHTEPEAGYSANLRRYVSDVRAMGAIPILVSPLSRRNYLNGKLFDDGLRAYAEAVRAVAASEHVTFVDLFALSTRYLDTLTQAQADMLDATGHPDAKAENGSAQKPDRTHLNAEGKALFGRMVADNAERLEPSLGPDVVGEPATAQSPLQAAPTDGH